MVTDFGPSRTRDNPGLPHDWPWLSLSLEIDGRFVGEMNTATPVVATRIDPGTYELVLMSALGRTMDEHSVRPQLTYMIAAPPMSRSTRRSNLREGKW
jgi:hypothetical protein